MYLGGVKLLLNLFEILFYIMWIIMTKNVTILYQYFKLEVVRLLSFN
jgi:hypothetical protein